MPAIGRLDHLDHLCYQVTNMGVSCDDDYRLIKDSYKVLILSINSFQSVLVLPCFLLFQEEKKNMANLDLRREGKLYFLVSCWRKRFVNSPISTVYSIQVMYPSFSTLQNFTVVGCHKTAMHLLMVCKLFKKCMVMVVWFPPFQTL